MTTIHSFNGSAHNTIKNFFRPMNPKRISNITITAHKPSFYQLSGFQQNQIKQLTEQLKKQKLSELPKTAVTLHQDAKDLLKTLAVIGNNPWDVQQLARVYGRHPFDVALELIKKVSEMKK